MQNTRNPFGKQPKKRPKLFDDGAHLKWPERRKGWEMGVLPGMPLRDAHLPCTACPDTNGDEGPEKRPDTRNVITATPHKTIDSLENAKTVCIIDAFCSVRKEERLLANFLRHKWDCCLQNWVVIAMINGFTARRGVGISERIKLSHSRVAFGR